MTRNPEPEDFEELADDSEPDEPEEPEDLEDDDDDEGEAEAPDEDEDDGTASLDELLAQRAARRAAADDTEDDDDIMAFGTERDERVRDTPEGRVIPIKDRQEFVCSRCHLVKAKSQLADPQRGLCRDCV
jgi:Domain of unknown function (DUF4193)